MATENSPRRGRGRDGTSTTAPDAGSAPAEPAASSTADATPRLAADLIAAGEQPPDPPTEPDTARSGDEPQRPSYITAEWYPANVLLPDGRTFTNVRVYATDVGLLVFDRPDREVFRSAIDYATAPRPTGDPQTHGNQVQTADGTVYVGLTIASCGSCGDNVGLRRWVPDYAGRIVPWGITGEQA